MKTLLWLSLLVLAVGGVNWGLVGLFEYDLVASIFGEEFGATNTVTRVVYVLVGASAVVSLVALAATEMGGARSMHREEHHA